ncbi:MAG: hypothetical protein JSW20_05215 [Nitrospiraceae bacterium]|nr:MAG: hypothetical protein JSW20_05215 [Nitrospiraceae bacterium]
MKSMLMKLYILGFAALSIFFMIIIWKVTFAHVIEEYHERQEVLEALDVEKENEEAPAKTTFQKIILDSEETVKHYLGYKVLEEKRIKGHFHHIGMDIGPDQRSYCVECHGDMPHDQIKDLRAFLNMHAFFIGCQTCHVKLEGEEQTGEFRWYDRRTGVIIPSPVAFEEPGTYKSKIIPFESVNGQPTRIDSDERISFAREFRETKDALTEAQSTKAKKLIHKIVSKQPYVCEDCHNTKAPVLPLEKLGYPKERIDSILSTEVVGLIKNYTKFYMPRMLHPGDKSEKESEQNLTPDIKKNKKPLTITKID